MSRMFRDPLSGLTHFIAIWLAVAGLIVLLTVKPFTHTPLHLTAYLVFGVGMVLLYTFSTLYHWLPLTGKRLELFRRLDHIMIFIFIAATYTPICLITLQGNWGHFLLISIWLIALAGVLVKIYWLNAPRLLSTGLYVLMGWFALVGIYPLIQALPLNGLIWLTAGGVFYTVGAAIYSLKKPDPLPGVFGFHEIFHLFVMMGSFAHYWLIYQYV